MCQADLCFYHHSFSSDSYPLTLLLPSSKGLCDCIGSTQIIPHLNSLHLITPAESLFLHKVTWSRVPGTVLCPKLPLCPLPHSSSPPQTLAPTGLFCLHGSAFSGMSQSWIHTEGRLFPLLPPLSNMHLRFLQVCSWLDSSFLSGSAKFLSFAFS